MTVTAPRTGAPQYPSLDLYDAISCPMALVLARRGLYAEKQAALDTVVAASANRKRIDIDANHNVPMTRPLELADIILDVVRDHNR